MSHWNCVEVNVAIVCACLMTMKPLICRLWPRLLDPSSNEAHMASMEDFVVEGKSDASPDGSLATRYKPSDMEV
jgi:hypothetical protein